MQGNAGDDELHIPAITPGNVDWPLFLYHNIDFHSLLFLHPLPLRSRPCALALLWPFPLLSPFFPLSGARQCIILVELACFTLAA